jgi:hypothetical protein
MGRSISWKKAGPEIMKKIIVLCAVCKRQMDKAQNFGEPPSSLIFSDEEVLYSHGICYDCGVNLYGYEIMDKMKIEPYETVCL